MGSLIAAVLLAALGIFLASNYFMRASFTEHFQKDMHTMRRVVDDDLANIKDRLFQEVTLLARSEELQQAYRAGDAQRLAAEAKSAMERFRASFATFTDADGTVLARGYSEKRGDSIADSAVMRAALGGKAAVDVLRLKNNGLSVGAAAPVVIDGNIVGAVLFGDAFRTHAFVDEIKRVTDLEMTVFDNDERISTTIIREGERAVGTRLDNPEIAATVLQEGGTYSANADILGKAYKTVYWPLRNNEGKILGMWFIGTEVEGLKHTITTVALSCLAATMIIAAALSLLSVMLFRSMINPLEKKAFVDMLTGITNRAGFEKAFDSALLARHGSGVLFLIDLDHFKDLNDNLGHPVGDECLRRTARLLKDVFRETDIVARLGGDEFIVYAPTMDQAETIREKAREFLENCVFKYRLDSGAILTVTASMGIAVYPRDADSYVSLYNKADNALYASKNGGRNRFTIFSEMA